MLLIYTDSYMHMYSSRMCTTHQNTSTKGVLGCGSSIIEVRNNVNGIVHDTGMYQFIVGVVVGVV